MRFDLRPSVNPIDVSERSRLLLNPTFGTVFTDNMIVVQYSKSLGWHDAVLTARAPTPMNPAAAVLHYAQEIFESLTEKDLGDFSGL